MVEFRKICHIDLCVEFDMVDPFKIFKLMKQKSVYDNYLLDKLDIISKLKL